MNKRLINYVENYHERRLKIICSHLTDSGRRQSCPKVHFKDDTGFILRDMTQNDVVTVVEWFSLSESQCVHDLHIALDCFGQAKNAFFIVGELNGELVGSFVFVPWAPNITYGGYFIVAEKFRSYGYGRRIFEFIHAQMVAQNITWVVDSLLSRSLILFREKNITEDYFINYFSGFPRITTTVSVSQNRKKNGNISVVPHSAVNWDSILRYDDAHFHLANSANAHLRHQFMSQFCAVEGSLTCVAVEEERVVGFGCRRQCVQQNSHFIGPIYADSYDAAEMVMAKLCKDLDPVDTVTLYVSDQNTQAVQLMKYFGLQVEHQLIRGYGNGRIAPLKDDVYAIMSSDICGF